MATGQHRARPSAERSSSPPRSAPLGRGGAPLQVVPLPSPHPGASAAAPPEGEPPQVQGPAGGSGSTAILQELRRVTEALAEGRADVQRALRHVEGLEAERLRLEQRLLQAREREAELLRVRVSGVQSAARAEADALRREAAGGARQCEAVESLLASVRSDLEQAEAEREALRQRDSEREGTLSALQEQLGDTVRALAEEQRRGEALAAALREHDALSQGHPVVGLELSEGAPYDIAGVWVVSVAEGGPADLCGIRKGDVISEVAGVPVPTREDFRAVIDGGDFRSRPGQQLSFRVHRESDGGAAEQHTVMLTLGWSSRRPEGRRVITVQRTPPAKGSPGETSPSPQRPRQHVTPEQQWQQQLRGGGSGARLNM